MVLPEYTPITIIIPIVRCDPDLVQRVSRICATCVFQPGHVDFGEILRAIAFSRVPLACEDA